MGKVRVGVAVFGVVGLLAVGAVMAATTTSNAKTRGVIMFAGDSNIYLNSFGIAAVLSGPGAHGDNGYVPVLASRPGVALRSPDCLVTAGCTTGDYWKVKLAGILPKIQADAYVTNLGINDTGSAGTATGVGYYSYSKKIDWFMQLIPAGKLVIWTNLPCSIEPPSRLTGCRTVNYALALAKARWSNLVIADWAAVANSHPEYIAQPGSDVHLSPAGHSAWIALVARELDSRLAPK